MLESYCLQFLRFIDILCSDFFCARCITVQSICLELGWEFSIFMDETAQKNANLTNSETLQPCQSGESKTLELIGKMNNSENNIIIIFGHRNVNKSGGFHLFAPASDASEAHSFRPLFLHFHGSRLRMRPIFNLFAKTGFAMCPVYAIVLREKCRRRRK